LVAAVTVKITVRRHSLPSGVNVSEPSYALALGARLRAIRVQQGLSLHAVERKSNGRWKAVVIGSYERGSRAVTVQRLAELADFYGVPVAELLPGGLDGGATSETAGRIVLDLERLAELPKYRVAPLARYVATIARQRGDYNGRILTVRQDDLRTLAIIYDETPARLAAELIELGVLRSGSDDRVIDLRSLDAVQ
jgi:transcriptional regulator with XRE-family HTH domain